jgi:hypothetical protein
MDTLVPSSDLTGDLQSLQETVSDDVSGDKTRRLLAYFRNAETTSREMQLHSSDFEEKHFAGMVSDAFGASSRILAASWRKAHGRELVQ